MNDLPESWKDTLRSAQLFGELDAEALARVAREFRERRLTGGECLLLQGDEPDSVFVVMSGALEVYLEGHDEAHFGTLGPGSVVGELALIVGGRRSATVRALEPTALLELGRDRFESLLRENPQARATFATTLLSRARRAWVAKALRDLLGRLDAEALAEIEGEIGWVYVQSGKALFHQGSPAEAAYIVAAGRLRVVVSTNDGERFVDEVGPGRWIGEMSLLTQRERSATVYAVRDSELVVLSQAMFHRLMQRYPEAVLETARRLASRLAEQTSIDRSRRLRANALAIVPAAPTVDVARFAADLVRSMSRYGTVLHLTSAGVDERLGKKGISSASSDDPAHLRLIPWLLEQEFAHSFIVYEGDRQWSGWNERAVRNADRVLLVAEPVAASPPYEAMAYPGPRASEAHGPKRTLVLIQPSGADAFPGTSRWLQSCDADDHFHVRRGSQADVDRVARILTGNAICLVLGGGASRGFAHIGALRAFEELQIPVDAVGGTSMGGAIAFGIARGQSSAMALRTGREISQRFFDPTLPWVSLMSAKRIARGIAEVAEKLDIEDLLMPFFCVSTNLTRGLQVVHRRGNLATAVQATTAIPGIFPPVRVNGDLLVDGGLSDNVPVAAMVSLFGGVVVAVDVIPDVDLRVDQTPTQLGGWQETLRRLNPLAGAGGRGPNIASILLRSVTVASDSLRSGERSAKLASLYLRPHVENWNLLDFGSATSIAEQGYRSMIEPIRAWWRENGNRLMGRTPSALLPPGPHDRGSSRVVWSVEDPPPSSLW